MTTTNDLNRLVNAIQKIVDAEPDTLHREINAARKLADDVSRTYCLDGSETDEEEDEPEFVPPPGVMTFEQFQASKKHSDDLAKDLPDQLFEAEGGDPTHVARGWIYDGTYFIDEVLEWWPEDARREGRWHLLLERSEFITDDLESLERKLYRWCVQSGGLSS